MLKPYSHKYYLGMEKLCYSNVTQFFRLLPSYIPKVYSKLSAKFIVIIYRLAIKSFFNFTESKELKTQFAKRYVTYTHSLSWFLRTSKKLYYLLIIVWVILIWVTLVLKRRAFNPTDGWNNQNIINVFLSLPTFIFNMILSYHMI